MFNKLILDNWEAHKHTEIEFSSLVTILSGNSDSGKSSIFRALRFVLLNKFEEGNINYEKDVDECCVALEIGTHTIKRIRSKSVKGKTKKNEYWLDDRVFTTFNKEIPSEITEVMNLSDINFEWQYDKKPFLINETGGYVATKINSYVDLEKIDSSLKNVNSLLKKERVKLEEATENARELYNSYNSLTWVDKAIIQFEQINKLQSDCDALESKLTTMENLLNSIENVSAQIKLICPKEEAERKLEKIVTENKRILEIKTKILKEDQLINTYRETTEGIETIKTISERRINTLEKNILQSVKIKKEIDLKEHKLEEFNNLQKINIKVLPDRQLIRLEKNILDALNLQKEIKTKISLQEEISAVTDNFCILGFKIDNLEKTYKNIMPEECPLCGTIIKKDTWDDQNAPF